MKRNKYINTFDTTAEYENYIESAAAGFPNVALTKDNDKVNYMSMSPNEHVIFGELVDPTNPPKIKIGYNGNYAANITSHVDVVNNTFYIDQSDLTAANVGTITNLDYFFYGSTNTSVLNNVTLIKKIALDTSSCTSFAYTFDNCRKMVSVDVSSFDTSNVTSMRYMFNQCMELTSVDLSSFDTSNVTTIENIFNNCNKLKTIDLSGWNLENNNSTYNSFAYCNALTDVYITVEATLNKLTNNLSSQGNNYIPSNNGNCTIHYTNNGVTTDYKWQNNAWRPQS